eukprot:gene5861-8085_t
MVDLRQIDPTTEPQDKTIPMVHDAIEIETFDGIIIRQSVFADLNSLFMIEVECWGDLAVSSEVIERRLNQYPPGQFVAYDKINNNILGVIYTQLVDDVNVYLDSSCKLTFDNMLEIHTESGTVCQLISVCVPMKYTKYQIGEKLRNHVINYYKVNFSIVEFIAMTRCMNSEGLYKSFDEFEKYVFHNPVLDPILHFHTSAGAKIIKIMKNFRPIDKQNKGCSVLIKYELNRKADGTNTSISVNNDKIIPINLNELEILGLILKYSSVKCTPDFITGFLDCPFMHMNIDSLQMIMLREDLLNLLRIKSGSDHLLQNITPTIFFDFPTPKQLLKLLNSDSIVTGNNNRNNLDNLTNNSSRSALQSIPQNDAELFAVCGMSCRFPSSENGLYDCSDPERYFEALCGGMDAVREVPPSWQSKTRYAAFLDESYAEYFDPSRYNLSVAECKSMDPHQRILLDVTVDALNDANISCITSSNDVKVGVFVGICNNDWNSKVQSTDADPFLSTGTSIAATANRISFLFGFTGPSMVIDTACSSSLVAVHTALNALKCGDCDIAVVAAADLLISDSCLRMRENSSMLSMDGRTKSFDIKADGYVRGEGAGAIIIQSLDRVKQRTANRRNPLVHAIIRSTSVNQDGRSASFTAPNGSSQRELLKSAISKANISPTDIAYIETHGTGTALGDPIEWGAIRDVILNGGNEAKSNPLVIGALKTNIGHLEGAAGIAGLIKCILCLKHKNVPKNLNFDQMNPLMLKSSKRNAEFPKSTVPLIPNVYSKSVFAGVSSFGSGGTNAHIILESYESERTAIEIEKELQLDAETSSYDAEHTNTLGFLFTGQGSLYLKMGVELFESEPSFRAAAQICSNTINISPTIIDVMFSSDDSYLNDIVYSQLILFALQIGLLNLWKSRSVLPTVVVGHSLGEYAAAVCCGVFTIEVGIELVYQRSLILKKISANNKESFLGMLAVKSSQSDVADALHQLSLPLESACIAAVNGINSVVLSGQLGSLTSILNKLNEKSGPVVHKYLPMSLAYHSPLLKAAAEEFKLIFNKMVTNNNLMNVTYMAPKFVSTFSGMAIDLKTLLTAEYWSSQMTNTVQFLSSISESYNILGIRTWVEIGPSSTLLSLAKGCLTNVPFPDFIPSLSKDVDSINIFNQSLQIVRKRKFISQSLSGNRILIPWRFQTAEIKNMDRKNDYIDLPISHNFNLQNVESIIRESLRESLSIRQEDATNINEDDSFLTLGIDSMDSLAIRSKIIKRLSFCTVIDEIPNFVIMKYPSIRLLANYLMEYIEHNINSSISNDQVQSIVNFDSDFEFSTSCIQRAMLFHHLSDATMKSFIETFVWDIALPLNIDLFYKAWLKVIGILPTLRTKFDPYATPHPTQTICTYEAIDEIHSLLNMEASSWYRVISVSDEQGLFEVIRQQRDHDYDVTIPLLFNISIVKVGNNDSLSQQKLVFTIHHLLIDGYSVNILLKTLSKSYQALLNNQPLYIENGSKSSYYYFNQFESNLIHMDNRPSLEYNNIIIYWKTLLDATTTSHLKIKGFSGKLRIDCTDDEVIRVSKSIIDSNINLQSLISTAKSMQTTLAGLFHTFWVLTYLQLLQDVDDITYASTSSGRSAKFNEVHDVIGPVINSFPIRVKYYQSTKLYDLISSIHDQLMNSLEHENYPLTEIQKLVSMKGNELFSVVFDFQQFDLNFEEKESFSLRNVELLDRIGCPLSVRIRSYDDVLKLTVTSECKSFGKDLINQLINKFTNVIESIIDCTLSNTNPYIKDILKEHSSDLNMTIHSDDMITHDYFEPSFPIIPGISEKRIFLQKIDTKEFNQLKSVIAQLGFDVHTVFISLLGILIQYFSSNSAVQIQLCKKKQNYLLAMHDSKQNITFYDMCNWCQAILKYDENYPQLTSNGIFMYVEDGASFHKSDDTVLVYHLQEHVNQIDIEIDFCSDRVPSELMDKFAEFHSAIIHWMMINDWEKSPVQIPSIVAPLLPWSDREYPMQVHLVNEKGFNEVGDGLVSFDGNGSRFVLIFSQLEDMCLLTATPLIDTVRNFKSNQKLTSNPTDNTCVIVVIMEKGWQQVVAVLSILRLQCAYLPIDAKLWSEARIRQVLQLSNAVAIMSQSHLLSSSSWSWLKELGIPVVDVDFICGDMLLGKTDAINRDNITSQLSSIPQSSPDDLAYLIYTSGSTGVPKGVCCHHVGAINTLCDLNDYFSITKVDRVLALSSLSFDLSVYDIFGMLNVMGTIVIPDSSCVSPPNPSEWYDLVVSEGITIWNTVPAFMELLVGHVEFMDIEFPASIRIIFMSGDWIPITLAGRIRSLRGVNPDLRIISMGGATEASIWSNMYEIGVDGSGIPEGWSSVPYGRPLRNQSMLILNDRMEHCDVWVTGSIYIGGAGVAHGYYKDPIRSSAQFINHPVTGERLFRTGDLGRIRPEGLIEILGREDAQVKVNGFRIELGEIERVLTQDSRVSSATLTVHNNSLCAYLVMKEPSLELSVDSESVGSRDYFVGSDNGDEYTSVFEDLKQSCKSQLTDYMIPKHFIRLDKIPLSPNGKVAKDKLPITFETMESDIDYDSPTSESEKILVQIWSSVLGLSENSMGVTTNFFSIGGDSLRSIRIAAEAKKVGLIISVTQIFDYPTIKELAAVAIAISDTGPQALGTNTEKLSEKPIFNVDHHPESELEEFPLIGINPSHFVGLFTSSFAPRGTSPQIYYEWEIGDGEASVLTPNQVKTVKSVQLDVTRFENAISFFVQRHPIFRSVVCPNGKMKILSSVPQFKITDVFEHGDDASTTDRIKHIRAYMVQNLIDVYTWPLFDVRVTHLSNNKSLVHIALSMFMMDALGDMVLRHELTELYIKSSTTPLHKILPSPSQLSYKDYSTAFTNQLPHSEEYLKAKSFWFSRLDNLSSSPELPLLPRNMALATTVTGIFVNQHRWLSVQEWRRAKKNCAYHSVTMPCVLVAAYAIALYKWGSRHKFIITILQCLRHQVHEDVNKIVGNTNSTILCEVDFLMANGSPLTFKVAVQRIAQELSRNLEHSSMSSVEVMQEFNRIHGKTFTAGSPFVFTSPINVENGNKQVQSRKCMFYETFFSERISHTACVNPVKDYVNGTACASFDVIDGIFPPEVVKGFFRSYSEVLDIICSPDAAQWYQPLSDLMFKPTPVPAYANNFHLPQQLMHQTFLNKCDINSLNETDAIIYYHKNSNGSQGIKLSHKKLELMSLLTATPIIDTVRNFKSNQKLTSNPTDNTCVIVVIMEKGWQQVVAVLSILRLQCAYLPIDAKLWSEARIRQVLQLSNAVAIMSQSHLLSSSSWSWLKELGIPVVDVDFICGDMLLGKTDAINRDNITSQLSSIPQSSPDDLAYLIYTSGSTGVPKGVCCHHVGAINTLCDLNDYFSITKVDRVLALSSLSFDLSVYDIFGMLNVMGTIVIPDSSCVSPPNPSEWYDLVVSEGITIWNTVPAFMELLVGHVEFMDIEFPASIRIIFMSGDWIPITLAGRIRSLRGVNPDLRIISMGGATEASIWSNMYEIGVDGSGIPEGWSSVPYGRPLRNQSMLILNDRMEHCDVWVTGSIYIGGAGVAHGYYKDPIRSSAQFINHPVTGERLFRTGDLGRIRPEGLIEILGREDAQVKVNGFRIELGEIERVLTQDSRVSSATLTVHNNSLCAYLVMKDISQDGSGDVLLSLFEDLKLACRSQLTEYMVPKHFMQLEKIPLSSNGKVIKDLLPNPFENTSSSVFTSNAQVIKPRTHVESVIRSIVSNTLRISEDIICVESSSFFELGGNSLSAIQFIYSIREVFKYVLSIQDFFQNPFVTNVAQLVENYLMKLDVAQAPDDMIVSSNVTKNDKQLIDVLTLNEGNGLNEMIMFLFNPAGASGLCYMDLISHINEDIPILALDDGVILNQRLFPFHSISEAVDHYFIAFEHILQQKKEDSTSFPHIILCGWSYGGVIAIEMAKKITLYNSSNNNAFLPIKVRSVIIFDSPLRNKVVSIENNNKTVDYSCEIEACQELTTGHVERIYIPGSHWTLIMKENASNAADIIQNVINNNK